MTEPLSQQLSLAGVEMASSNPQVHETRPSLADVRETVGIFKGENAAGYLQSQRKDGES